jgi:hypothetical protein
MFLEKCKALETKGACMVTELEFGTCSKHVRDFGCYAKSFAFFSLQFSNSRNEGPLSTVMISLNLLFNAACAVTSETVQAPRMKVTASRPA